MKLSITFNNVGFFKHFTVNIHIVILITNIKCVLQMHFWELNMDLPSLLYREYFTKSEIHEPLFLEVDPWN